MTSYIVAVLVTGLALGAGQLSTPLALKHRLPPVQTSEVSADTSTMVESTWRTSLGRPLAENKQVSPVPGGPRKEAKATSKTMTAVGKVTAIDASSLTVKGKDGEWTFGIDSMTTVTAKGASTKTAKMKAENKKTVITAFLKVGDQVSVRYHDMGGTKHAASVALTASAGK